MYTHLERPWCIWCLVPEVHECNEHHGIEDPGREAKQINEGTDVRGDDEQNTHECLQFEPMNYYVYLPQTP